MVTARPAKASSWVSPHFCAPGTQRDNSSPKLCISSHCSGGLDPAGECPPSQPPQTTAPAQPRRPGLCTNKAFLDHDFGAGCLWIIVGSWGETCGGSPGVQVPPIPADARLPSRPWKGPPRPHLWPTLKVFFWKAVSYSLCAVRKLYLWG
ncbi:unnamed protein product [Gulo gulo]|uniref:Uncharacterized protein n=1 Tax=Gulo gulo TaxID=48420 RepID=A0A9X9PTX1_GULGU|nr:unnamed protein product [Gulo gulo]